MIAGLAKLHSPGGTLISLTVERRPGAVRTGLSSLLRPIKEAGEAFDRDGAKSIRTDVARILDFADDIEELGGRGVAIFASKQDDIWEVRRLEREPINRTHLSTRPYLRGVRVLPNPMRAGVALVDHAASRLWVADGEGMHVIEKLTADIGKSNYGGYEGYDEHTAQRRADEATTHMWKRASELLLVAHRSEPFDLLAIGAMEETQGEFVDELHDYLSRLPEHRFTVDPNTTSETELYRVVDDAAAALRKTRDVAVIDAFLEAKGAGRPVTVGTKDSLEAINAHAVETLLVAGPFERDGVRCDACGWMSRVGEACPLCGSDTVAESDILSYAMDAVTTSGGTVRQVRVASQLDADGAGAILRFPIG